MTNINSKELSGYLARIGGIIIIIQGFLIFISFNLVSYFYGLMGIFIGFYIFGTLSKSKNKYIVPQNWKIWAILGVIAWFSASPPFGALLVLIAAILKYYE